MTELIKVLPRAQVMALEAEVPIVEGRQAVRSPMGRVMPLSATGITVGRTLHDGETVTLGDVSIRVFATPGHTAGSASYLVNGVLFVGDSAQITSSGEIRPAPWLVTDDRALNRASLRDLARRLSPEQATVTTIVPAHSGAGDGIGLLQRFAQANP